MKWKYDGTPESLMPKSRRPHRHPNQHTDEEISLIKNMRKEFIYDGLNMFWYRAALVTLMSSLFRVMRKLGLYREKNKNPKYVPKSCRQSKKARTKILSIHGD